MPICRKCEHGAREHNWISPVCSRCGDRSPSCPFCFQKFQQGRKRGQCQHPGCGCVRIQPLTDQPSRSISTPRGCCIGRGGELRRGIERGSIGRHWLPEDGMSDMESEEEPVKRFQIHRSDEDGDTTYGERAAECDLEVEVLAFLSAR